MFTRGISGPGLCLCILSLAICPLTSAAEPKARSARSVASRPATGGDESPGGGSALAPKGSVQTALRHLGTLTRPNAKTAAAVEQSPKEKSSTQTPAKPAPDARREQRGAIVSDAPQVVVRPGGPYYYDPYTVRGRRLPYSTQDFSDYNYFDGRPDRYGYDGFGAVDDYSGGVYRFGFMEGYYLGQMEKEANERQERVLTHAANHFTSGLQLFREGKYREAADAFRIASDANQGDASARIYATHALFAVGRYRDAMKHLRRAFELQPKIALLNYDMRDDYAAKGEFERQLSALEQALQQSPNDLDRLILLGYVRCYSNQPERAFDVLSRARRINPRDPLVAHLMDTCQPSDVAMDALKRGAKR